LYEHEFNTDLLAGLRNFLYFVNVSDQPVVDLDANAVYAGIIAAADTYRRQQISISCKNVGIVLPRAICDR
jgi:hypothetical protein